MLPVAGAGLAAGLVQELRVSVAGGQRPARRARGFWTRTAARGRSARVGFERRDSLPRHPAAAEGTRADERRCARRNSHPRLDGGSGEGRGAAPMSSTNTLLNGLIEGARLGAEHVFGW